MPEDYRPPRLAGAFQMPQEVLRRVRHALKCALADAHIVDDCLVGSVAVTGMRGDVQSAVPLFEEEA